MFYLALHFNIAWICVYHVPTMDFRSLTQVHVVYTKGRASKHSLFVFFHYVYS